MKTNKYDEEKSFNDLNNSETNELRINLNRQNEKSFSLIFLFIFFTLINAIILMINFSKKDFCLKVNMNKNSNLNSENNLNEIAKAQIFSQEINNFFIKERDRPYFKEINKKRTFDQRYPLTKQINCKPHFTTNEFMF